MGQIADLIGFKRHVSIKDRIEAYASRPDIDWEALVADFLHNLGSDVCRRAALFEKELILFNSPADAEVTDLHVTLDVQ